MKLTISFNDAFISNHNIIHYHHYREQEGWPEKLPINHLSEGNRKIMAEHCSGQESPDMPELPTTMATGAPYNNLPAKRRSFEDAKIELLKRMQLQNLLDRAVGEEENAAVSDFAVLMTSEMERVFDDPQLSPVNFGDLLQQWGRKEDGHGLYGGERDDGWKLGEGNLEERTDVQSFHKRAVILRQSEISTSGYVTSKTVDTVMKLPLPMLKGRDESREERYRDKVWRQSTEGILISIYDVQSQGAFEFLTQMPTRRLRSLSNPSAFLNRLQEHNEIETIDAWMKNIKCIHDDDTWPTIYSELFLSSEFIDHLLPNEYQAVTHYLCRLNVDCHYKGFKDLYPDSPYSQLNKPLIDQLLKIVEGEGNRKEKAVQIRKDGGMLELLLANVDNKLKAPQQDEYAKVAKESFLEIFSGPTDVLHRVRNSIMHIIEKNPATSQWFEDNFVESIELECTQVTTTDLGNTERTKTFGGENRMTLYRSNSGHLFLSRNSHWTLFGLNSPPEQILNAIPSLSDESGFMNRYNYLSDDGLRKVQEFLLRLSMLATGLSSSLYHANGSVHNARHYVLPSDVGVPSGVPAGVKTIQRLFRNTPKAKSLYYLAILQIFQKFCSRDASKKLFNELLCILKGDEEYVDESPLDLGYNKNSTCQHNYEYQYLLNGELALVTPFLTHISNKTTKTMVLGSLAEAKIITNADQLSRVSGTRKRRDCHQKGCKLGGVLEVVRKCVDAVPEYGWRPGMLGRVKEEMGEASWLLPYQELSFATKLLFTKFFKQGGGGMLHKVIQSEAQTKYFNDVKNRLGNLVPGDRSLQNMSDILLTTLVDHKDFDWLCGLKAANHTSTIQEEIKVGDIIIQEEIKAGCRETALLALPLKPDDKQLNAVYSLYPYSSRTKNAALDVLKVMNCLMLLITKRYKLKIVDGLVEVADVDEVATIPNELRVEKVKGFFTHACK